MAASITQVTLSRSRLLTVAYTRFPIAFQIFFAVLLIVGTLAFPESPRWLLKHGKKEAAAEIMARLHSTTPKDEVVQNDIAEVEEINRITEGQKLTIREFLSNGKEMNLWRSSIACASQAFQQISGKFAYCPLPISTLLTCINA